MPKGQLGNKKGKKIPIRQSHKLPKSRRAISRHLGRVTGAPNECLPLARPFRIFGWPLHCTPGWDVLPCELTRLMPVFVFDALCYFFILAGVCDA